MKNEPNTYRGSVSMGVDYRTPMGCAEADLYEWLTASGNNPPDEALAYLREGREANLSEMSEQGWKVHALVVEEWDAVSQSVEEKLLDDLRGKEE